ncbi:Citrate transporter (plasmid) [Deinococcus proteolyticus MRP]|uniref:Citrate transporter n=1 Tax=Deinococcus proteolyticus (strain ATCC 35074 / DSM 20540 / JCM 6276 / NBRC 101906 / NCIMB 13154 / VKM Ac-1939 / CCM 2703 / MRP) TaxID=693977 RepID=F0RPL0_DEIPM|nr:Citrate transporter [Deinococcus proteolyticus MRP]
MLGLLGIVISLAGLIYFAYRGVTVLVLAPLMALLAVLFSGVWSAELLATYTQVFMQSLGKYLTQFFPVFLLGAIFGKVMADSGAAEAIARWMVNRLGAARAIAAVVLSCGILTYGGVSLFVVAFAVFPIAVSLFRAAGVPRRLIPAAIALGSFTMTAIPGTPAIQNAIPAAFFGTDTFAAPGLGLIAGAIMLFGGLAWLQRRAAVAQAAGEGYGEPGPNDGASSEGGSHRTGPHDIGPHNIGAVPQRELPGIGLAVLPIVAVIGLNYLLSRVVFPATDLGFLAQERFGAVQPGAVTGLWSLIAALAAATVLALVLHRRFLSDPSRSVNEGTLGSLLPIFNTASEVAYGAVIASLAAFALVRDAVLSIAPANPTVSLAVAVNTLAGITGSASGGAEHRAGYAGCHLLGTGAGRRHLTGAAAPGRHHLFGRVRRPAPQRRRGHAAGHHRPDPRPLLPRYFRGGRGNSGHGAAGGVAAGQRVRQLLADSLGGARAGAVGA